MSRGGGGGVIEGDAAAPAVEDDAVESVVVADSGGASGGAAETLRVNIDTVAAAAAAGAPGIALTGTAAAAGLGYRYPKGIAPIPYALGLNQRARGADEKYIIKRDGAGKVLFVPIVKSEEWIARNAKLKAPLPVPADFSKLVTMNVPALMFESKEACFDWSIEFFEQQKRPISWGNKSRDVGDFTCMKGLTQGSGQRATLKGGCPFYGKYGSVVIDGYRYYMLTEIFVGHSCDSTSAEFLSASKTVFSGTSQLDENARIKLFLYVDVVGIKFNGRAVKRFLKRHTSYTVFTRAGIHSVLA
ncbi:MAG: hypothetical protein FJY19_07945, partial [Bacteroidetes bacterium]|nr:hypothetical protein [Bacteroidota bacterium]